MSTLACGRISKYKLAPLSQRCLLTRAPYESSKSCQLLHYARCFQDYRLKYQDSLSAISSNQTDLINLKRFNAPLPAYFSQADNSPLSTFQVIHPLVLHPIVNFLFHRGYHDRYERANGSKNIGMTLAATLAILGIFKKSIKSDIEEERARLSDTEKFDRMTPLERKIAIGVLWMCDQEYVRANQLFHDALQLAQEEKDEDQEYLVLNLIATNYFESGDWHNAEKLFIDLMKRMIANGTEPTAPQILELSLKLASIYSKTPSTHGKALKGFKFVINSLRYELADVAENIESIDIQALPEEKRNALALLGWSYDWFAKHLLSLNDYEGAIDMLQRALQISSKVLGQLHDQTLILLNDIGTTLAMNSSPEEGRTFINKAVEGAIEAKSKELASFYVNLGLVNLQLRKLQEAKRYCEYSIEIVGKNREHHNSHEVIELSKKCLKDVMRFIGADSQ